MDALIATPTEYGLSVLTSSLKTTATRYKLFGADTYDATTTEEFYSATIENSFYDSNGVLTFQVELPIEQNFNKYMHSVVLTDISDQVIFAVSTPKSALASGIGGFLTIKVPVTGEAGEVVFKASDYVTGVELGQQLANHEKRHTQTINIGGSKDYLYPVWWNFPQNGFGVGKLTIHRPHNTNLPSAYSTTHNPSLLLEIEGNGDLWSGSANFIEIKRIYQRYHTVVSHLNFGMWSTYIQGSAENSYSNFCPGYSGVYLRGGGLDYVITSNWEFNAGHTLDNNIEIYNGDFSNYGHWEVSPIPIAEIDTPVSTVNAYVDA